jgi:hypothetical protein
MDIVSGIFTVSDPGIYQITFTAKYVSSNRGRFGAWSDMYVNQTVSVSKKSANKSEFTNFYRQNSAIFKVLEEDRVQSPTQYFAV